jgi:hypothetical protein
MRQLYVYTVPSRFVHEGFALLPHAYARVVALEATATRASPGKHIIPLQLPAQIAGRLENYCKKYFDEHMNSHADIDCAHFACSMANIAVSDWQHALQALDTVKSQVIQPTEMPRGYIGVIASAQVLPEHDFHHILHAGVSLGDGRWLNVTGLGGNLAVSQIAEDLAYQRAELQGWYGEKYEPAMVQLHLGPQVF